jgi:hypothetical protein
MELIVIEIFLWVGLIFFFWALKDGLGNVEADIDDPGKADIHANTRPLTVRRFDQPESVSEAIGCYKDEPIYRYAIIDGQVYQFNHIYPFSTATSIPEGQRCVAPGLIYSPFSERSENQVMPAPKSSGTQSKST